MTKNTKIILGLGAVGIALYLYNKNKASKSATSDVVTPTPIPAPDKMPTPVPDLPKADKMREEVHYCKDGFKEVIRMKESQWQLVKLSAPCTNHGGIDEAKTNKNRGGGTGEIIGCGSPTMCKHDEVFVNCRCQKRPKLDSFMTPRKGECPIGYKKIGVNEKGTAICQNLMLK